MDLEKEIEFVDALDWYLDHLQHVKGASQHTIDAYRHDILEAISFFQQYGCATWDDVSPAFFVKYQTSIAGSLRPSSLRRKLSSVRSMMKFLAKKGQGSSVELPNVSGIRLPKRYPKALSLETITRLLELPKTDTADGLRDRCLMEFVYGAGLRVSEACSIQVSDIDFENENVRVTGKRGKTRWIPIPSETMNWIHRYLDEARSHLIKGASGHLFVNNHGRILARDSAYRILEKYAKRAGIQSKVGPHVLRHTYAVHLLNGGADLRTVQELLGHANINTTQIYTQLDLEEVQKKYRLAHPRK